MRASDGSIVFDTSKEAAYPRLLCERFATVLSMQASVLDLALNPAMSKPAEDSRLATYKQPRRRKIPPLISEFDETKIIRGRNSDEPKLDDKNRLTADFYGVPAGSKLLRKALVDKGDSNIHKTMWVFGIFRNPLTFLTIAKEVQRPFDSFRAVPPEILNLESGLQYSFKTPFADYEEETGKAATLETLCERVVRGQQEAFQQHGLWMCSCSQR